MEETSGLNLGRELPWEIYTWLVIPVSMNRQTSLHCKPGENKLWQPKNQIPTQRPYSMLFSETTFCLKTSLFIFNRKGQVWKGALRHLTLFGGDAWGILLFSSKYPGNMNGQRRSCTQITLFTTDLRRSECDVWVNRSGPSWQKVNVTWVSNLAPYEIKATLKRGSCPWRKTRSFFVEAVQLHTWWLSVSQSLKRM